MNRARSILVFLAFLFWLSFVLWGTLSEGNSIHNAGGFIREFRDHWKDYWMQLPPAILDNYRILKDIAINFLIFIPLGFFLGLLARRYLKGTLAAIGLGWLISHSISWGIEFLQHSVAGRYPSSRDVTWNTLGGIFGTVLAMCFLGFMRRFLKLEKEVV